MTLDKILQNADVYVPTNDKELHQMVADTRLLVHYRSTADVGLYNRKMYEYAHKYGLNLKEALHNVKEVKDVTGPTYRE